jgi:hypothetical protein
MVEVEPSSNNATALNGERGLALWAQRSWRFRLPVVGDGMGGKDCDKVGRKCISSVITANWRFSLVKPKIRPVRKLLELLFSGGKFAQRCPFLKYAVRGNV